MYGLKDKAIWVAGHNGMVGRAVMRQLENHGCQLLTADRSVLDLTDQNAVKDWLADNKPDAVIICAAKVGGILANDSLSGRFSL